MCQGVKAVAQYLCDDAFEARNHLQLLGVRNMLTNGSERREDHTWYTNAVRKKAYK
jgi:hypothetical protein